MDFKIVPIERAVAEHVRTTMRAYEYDHPAWKAVASGTGTSPCRLCLEPIEPGSESLIAFTYDAFLGREELPLPGPIFVHERDCTPYERPGEFPHRLGKAFVLDAYQVGRRLLSEQRVDTEAVADNLRELLARPEVDYVHVRSARAGCYLCTAVPAPPTTPA